MGKIIVLAVLLISLIVYDWPKLKQKSRKIKIIYAMVMVVSLYLSVDFVLFLNLYNVSNLLHDLLFQPANQIVELLKIQ